MIRSYDNRRGRSNNLERLLRFYQDTLGLEPHSRYGDFVSFRLGKIRLGIGLQNSVTGQAKDPHRIMINLGTKEIHGLTQRLMVINKIN